MRTMWARHPGEIIDSIIQRIGQVRTVQAVLGGSSANLAVTVTGSAGRVFVKAAPKVSPDEDGPQVRALRTS